MNDCIFCKIVNKEIPTHVVYEDDDFLAFLDIHPQSPGHCQIIPKKHYRWVWDLPESPSGEAGVPNIGDYFRIVQKIALAQQKAFNTEMILCRITGEEVEHAHIWVFPNDKVAGDKNNFENNKGKILEALSSKL